MDLYDHSELKESISVYLMTATKEVYLPDNITSVLLRVSPTIPAILKQSSSELISSIPLEYLSTDTIVSELRSRFYLLRNGEESISTFLPFLLHVIRYYDSCQYYPPTILTQLLSILQDLRIALRNTPSMLPRLHQWMIDALSHLRDSLLLESWEERSSLDRYSGKNILLFLLTIHDKRIEDFINTRFEGKSIDSLEYVFLPFFPVAKFLPTSRNWLLCDGFSSRSQQTITSTKSTVW